MVGRTATVAAALVALTACTASTAARSPQSSGLSELRVGDHYAIDGVLPPKYARNAQALVYSCLLNTSPTGGLETDLATAVPSQANGMISRDGRTIEYHLRHDVHWQDGVPLDAEDVVFTQQTIMNGKNLYAFQFPYSEVESIRALDRYTVRIRTKRVLASIIPKWFAGNFCLRIIPRHIFAKYPTLADAPSNTQAVGSGPYAVARRTPDRTVFQAYPRYFGGAPHIGRIVDVYMPDTNTRVTQMRTGELDADLSASPTEAFQLRGDPALAITVTSAPQPGVLMFNAVDPMTRDRGLRQAIMLALDRKTMARLVSFGYFDADGAGRAFFGWAYDPTVRQPPYDAQRANAELDALGWTRGPDGVRRRKGQRLELLLVSSTDGVDPNVDVQIQNQLAGVGIAVTIKTYTGPVLYAPKEQGGVIAAGRFQMEYAPFTLAGWDGDLSALIDCDQAPPAGVNYGLFCDPRLDALYKAGYSTFDPAARRKYYSAAQRIVYDDAPYVLLWSIPKIDIYTKRLTDFVGSPEPFLFSHVTHWTVRPPA